MKPDALRFGITFLACFFTGYITGHYAIAFAAGLSLFIYWQYHEYKKVLAWLRKRHRSNGPDQRGMVDDIAREIGFIKDRARVREKKLRGFLKRFQKATSALPDAVILLGFDNDIEWANKKASEYLGVKWPQDSGLRINNLIRRPELTRYLKVDKSALARGVQLSSPVDAEIFLEIRVSLYGDHKKLLVARDVTSINKANQMRKDFIANASHELRTPLTVISGYLESFVDDDLCPQEWLAYIRQMRTQTARMQNLIEDLLTLSTIEAGGVNVEKDVVRVPDLLNSITNEARTLSGEQQHVIELDAEPSLYVYGNHAHLYSAFSNIIFNAIQYTPAGCRVSIRWHSDEAGAHLTVVDNGSGIASEHIPRLTERFYRIDKGRSREKGGTGLGLAIVKHVLAKHGGQLSVASESGQGSTFTCHLPKSRIAQLEPAKMRA